MIASVRNFLERPFVDVAIRVFALAALLISLYLGYEQSKLSNEQQRLVTCQVNFNKVSDRVGLIRAQIADEDRKVVDDMVKAVTTAKTRGSVATALQNYLTARAENDAKRNANPLPLIKDYCG